MTIRLFITGTDTHVGKTHISTGLLKGFNRISFSTLGIKPVASGCKRQGLHLFNDDALSLQQASSIKLPYEKINPFAFAEPIAPHIAAAKTNQLLTIERLEEALKETLNYPSDLQLIEGVGGWYVPLNANETMAQWVVKHKFPIILVVGMRLGCLNHALLTAQAIQASGGNLIGWTANRVDKNMLSIEENIAALKIWLRVPFLGDVPHKGEADEHLAIKQICNFTQ